MIAREPSRRLFLKQSVSGVSAASVAANYTPVLESEDFVQQACAAAHLRSSSSSHPTMTFQAFPYRAAEHIVRAARSGALHRSA